MKQFLLYIAGFFFMVSAYGQNACDVNKLSLSDKNLLNKFWTDFKIAIYTKDKLKLSTLCHFPFSCDYCIIDSSKDKNYDYIKITKKLYDGSQFKIFFNDQLKSAINTTSALKAITPNYGGKNNACSYKFGYSWVVETKEYPGQSHFFTIEKINGKFVITSAWTME